MTLCCSEFMIVSMNKQKYFMKFDKRIEFRKLDETKPIIKCIFKLYFS